MIRIIDLLLFLVPLYVANSAPVVLGGGAPLDLNITFPDGRRLLGSGKTMRGFLAGVLAGTAAGGILALIYPLPFFAGASQQFIASFALALGTMSGDALGSFIKRRVGMEPGRPFPLDNVFFVVISLVFVFPLASANLYEPFNIAFFLILTFVLHPLTNALANRLGLKSVPW